MAAAITSDTSKQAILVLVLLCVTVPFVAVHKSYTQQVQVYEKWVHEILDRPYKEERSPSEEAQSSYDPVVVTLEHLLSGNLPEALNRPHYKNESAHSEFNPRGACCQMLSDVLIGHRKSNDYIECKGVTKYGNISKSAFI